jgi:uncharacterized membrane protein YdjX (TVP38/TMEM64 family)
MTATTELPIHRGHAWRRIGILTLLCIGLAALTRSDVLHAALIELLTVIEAVITDKPLLGATLFILFAAVSAMFAFVSIAAVVPVAVYTWGPFFSIVLLWIGWIVGGIVSYGIGRYLGRPVVSWLTSSNDSLRKLESRVKRDSPFGLVLLFQLALPSEIPGYVLGLARYSLPRYLLALGLAELPYTVATVLMGQSFVQRRSGAVLAIGAVVILSSIATYYALRKRLSSHAASTS